MVDKPTYNGLFENSKKLAERVSDLERKLLIQSNTWITKDAGRLFSELFNKAGDIILLHKMGENNQPGTILMANPAAIRILGYSEDELNEMTLNDLIEKETKEFNQDELHFKEILKFERILLNKDRQRLFVEVHTHEFKQDEEQLAFTIIYDVTDRRLMLEALRVSEGKYKRLVESLSNEYIFYSHNKDGMITYISPSIEKVLGYSQEEASRNYKEFLTPHEMNIKSLEHSEQSIKGMVQPPFMNELYHRDGSTRIFYNTEIPVFDEKGEVIAVEGISKDITEWKKI